MRRSRRREETRELIARLDRTGALVHALFHDLAAWLSRTQGPLTPERYGGYRVPDAGALSSPAERMARYLDRRVLDAWAPVLEGWLAAGYRYRPSYGRSLRLSVTEGGGPAPTAVVRFLDRSEVEVPGGERCRPGRHWSLEVGLSRDASTITSAVLREEVAFDPSPGS